MLFVPSGISPFIVFCEKFLSSLININAVVKSLQLLDVITFTVVETRQNSWKFLKQFLTVYPYQSGHRNCSQIFLQNLQESTCVGVSASLQSY